MTNIQQNTSEMRRMFHRFPEVGFTEFITTYEIYKKLEPMAYKLYLGDDVLLRSARVGVPGNEAFLRSYERAVKHGVPEDFLEHIKEGTTGVIATLDTGKPGPHFAARFDIDGLPIKESADNDHIPSSENFISLHEGEMHACGHDGHITTGLFLADYINTNKDKLKGRFTIIFQAAEESVRGAKSVVEKGWLDDVDYFFSGHLGIRNLPVGTVSASTTDFLASSKFDVKFTGKSAHAGVEPDAGNNSLLAASAAALNLNAIARHGNGSTRINVGTMKAGSGRNVIADAAFMEIETRGETTELNHYMYNKARTVIQAAADMYENEVEIIDMGEAPNAVCSDELIEVVTEAVKENTHITDLKESLPLGASEDVTMMIERVHEKNGKATYMLFPYELKYGHHHPKFDLDESVLHVAVSTYIDIVNSLMKSDEIFKK
ncbi:MAG: amidohydrolase [Jeotgalicoccus sp.]